MEDHSRSDSVQPAPSSRTHAAHKTSIVSNARGTPSRPRILSPEARSVVEYISRACTEARICYQNEPIRSQVPLALSGEFIRCRPRAKGGACPLAMTIPQFKEWAFQTGADVLRVADLSLWKSPDIWRHEFIVVTLEPDASFTPKALPTPSSPLHSFRLEENVKKGLKFRIDRGIRARATLSRKGSWSLKAGVDSVELMNYETKFDGCVSCFSLLARPNLNNTHLSRGQYLAELISPRVSDVLFCLDRVSETIGPEYTLYRRNCWTFSSFIFRLMHLLFDAALDMKVSHRNNLKGFIRRHFVGISVGRPFLGQLLHPPFITPVALFGHQKDRGIPLSRNPFRSLFIGVCLRYSHIRNLLDISTTDATDLGMRLLTIVKYTAVRSELISSGMVALLEMLINRHMCSQKRIAMGIPNDSAVLALSLLAFCIFTLPGD
ncbi:hypothetical protein SERLA73DRAFT_75700 [Serpula lacrymans var. lacrymans S7.3]|uniref:Uncharacterized protein n=2 Tax=Serpula lacrymans var. lacrymans TaxID=341189 RepID=F8Q3Z4_SERL3|nr:uncharacterized protein SERLADRAFT_473278 [Serpula lacrymans var. lacrymans S7.9]EGN96850.1 hypothetical protein SERLA73DRAFT_75700 [Serpula lacrymans var. lacrymans S7.3]EGO22450.1 hypothetical protein SERLADRAFT_473278 [Serpula lacrymans var. lacrymans S7.9]